MSSLAETPGLLARCEVVRRAATLEVSVVSSVLIICQ